MSFAEQCRYLTGEPFCLSLAEIGRLDDYQIASVYGYPCDEETGKPLPSHRTPARVYEDDFKEAFFVRGLSRRRVEEKWRQFTAPEETAGNVSD